jgi:transcriptional regulator with XRE-family HTH domain
MASAFGARLRRLREAKKLTLQQVADAVGCTKAYIWELEMKDGQRPSAERVQALAKVLGVTMEDIMGEPIEIRFPKPVQKMWPSSASTLE